LEESQDYKAGTFQSRLNFRRIKIQGKIGFICFY